MIIFGEGINYNKICKRGKRGEDNLSSFFFCNNLFLSIFFVEFLNSSRAVDQFLFSGKIRMT